MISLAYVVKCCQNENRRTIALRSDILQEHKARSVRQHQVENDGVEMRSLERGLRIGAGVDSIDSRTAKRKSDLDPIRDKRIIFDNEEAHRLLSTLCRSRSGLKSALSYDFEADAVSPRRFGSCDSKGSKMSSSLTRRYFMSSVSSAAIALSIAAPDLGIAEVLAGEGKHVTLLHFTDTHAQLETHPEYMPGASPQIQMMGGFARLKTAIEQERANCKGACLLLDGGDEFQGSGPAAWSEGEVILEPLKALGADVFTLGNWEASYGPERFMETMARLNCPVVCYNLHDIASGKRVFPAYIAIERQGVKIVVVGVTDIGASKRQPPSEFRGMDTTSYRRAA